MRDIFLYHDICEQRWNREKVPSTFIPYKPEKFKIIIYVCTSDSAIMVFFAALTSDKSRPYSRAVRVWRKKEEGDISRRKERKRASTG